MLDETTDVVSIIAAPWAALLIVTSLPYRLLQIVFVEQLLEFGTNASHYGNVLNTTANAAMIAFAISIAGRAVYARAVSLAASSGTNPGRETWRLPLSSLLGYLFIASVMELLFYATWFAIVTVPLTILVAGIAAGTSPLADDRRVLAPLRRIGRYSKDVKVATALFFVFTIALVVAIVNLAAAFSAGLWIANGFGMTSLARWNVLLSFGTRRFMLLLIAGAVLALEPFWIAANVILVRKSGAMQSGDDLRVWFRELAR